MKNIKTKILSLCVASFFIIPFVSVKAEGLGDKITNKQSEIAAIKQDWQQIKPQVAGKKEQIKTNHDVNEGLRKEVAAKRTTIKDLTKQIVQSKKTLTPDDISKLNSQSQVLKDDAAALSSLKGKIKTDSETIKTDIKNKNYDNISTQLDDVISIQNKRTDGLKKLSSDLDTMINSLKTALNNAQ